MRYTEVRMARIAHELLADIDKETVNFVRITTIREREPLGSADAGSRTCWSTALSGIAVGMATNIPPHNLGEVVNACLALIVEPEVDISELMPHVPGPGFPDRRDHQRRRRHRCCLPHRPRPRLRTGARQHRGDGQTRARTHRRHGAALPGQQGAPLEKIAELVRDKRIDGICELRDESDKDGMRDRDRAEAGRSQRRDPEQSVQADPDANCVRHQHGCAARRPAAS